MFKKPSWILLALLVAVSMLLASCGEGATAQPSESPSRAPTEAPTETPARAPIEPPTTAPPEPPTAAPTEAPTQAPTQAPTEAFTQPTAADSDCLTCHETSTVFVTNQWQRSRHYQEGVTCEACHQSDHSNPAAFEHNGHTISALVSPNQCARCHGDVVKEYQNSIHSKSGLIAQAGSALGGGSYWNIAASVMGWVPWDLSQGMVKKVGEVVTYGNEPITYEGQTVQDKYWDHLKDNPALEWGQYPPEMDRPDKNVGDVLQVFAQWGCLWCHGSTVQITDRAATWVQFNSETYPTSGAGRVNPDDSFGNCAACHPAHTFDLAVARSPHTCGRCHESEDHPNFEAYNRSLHGGIYFATQDGADYSQADAQPGKDYDAPSCAICHMGAVYKGGEQIYPSTHDPASISMWKFGAWRTTFVREKGMGHPTVQEVWIKVDPERGVEFVGSGTSGAQRITITYPSDGEKNRERAMAVCNQCHSEQWTGNYFLTADSVIYALSHIRDMTFDIEAALQDAAVYTPMDMIEIRNIGAMAVRPTQIMMYHRSPGYVWWEGVMRAAEWFADYVENSVTPRLGAEKTQQWINWISDYEQQVQPLQQGGQGQ